MTPGEVITDSEIESILGDYPKAFELYRGIKAFLGSRLAVKLAREELVVSQMTTYPPGYPSGDDAFVHIDLALSDRMAASLTHELCHAKMAIDGFPVFVGVVNNLHWAGESLQFARDLLTTLVNLLDHLTFETTFIATGLSRSEMIAGRHEQDVNIVANMMRTGLSRDSTALSARGLWNVYYLNELLTDRSTGTTSRSDSCERIGQELFETFNADNKLMMEWLETQRFMHAELHKKALEDLTGAIGMVSPSFCLIKSSSGGAVIVNLPVPAARE